MSQYTLCLWKRAKNIIDNEPDINEFDLSDQLDQSVYMAQSLIREYREIFGNKRQEEKIIKSKSEINRDYYEKSKREAAELLMPHRAGRWRMSKTK